MKVKELNLKNFAKYDTVNVSFDDKVTYLIGKNGSGKSTLGITGIHFMFQGIAEKNGKDTNPLIGERFRFIGPKAATAKGEMILHDEIKNIDIKVIRKLTKTGSELSFEAPEGMVLDQQWLTDLFNIFLIAPKRFTELSPKEQAKALGIDTKVYDDAIIQLKKVYTEINAVYRSFGELGTVEKVERVDVAELQKQKDAIRLRLNNQFAENKAINQKTKEAWESLKKNVDAEVSAHNNSMAALATKINIISEALATIKMQGYTGTEVEKWISDEFSSKQLPIKNAEDLYPAEPTYVEEIPDSEELKEIDTKILSASAINEKAMLYEQHLKSVAEKTAKENELQQNKDAQAAKENERLEYIKKFKLPFSNLSIGEDGELLLQGKPIKEPYFSTGELLKVIPILIASQNPELKYVFLQDFNLLDEDKQAEIEKHLTDNGFQLVVEMVGKEKIAEKNCILLKDNVVVEDYQNSSQPTLL